MGLHSVEVCAATVDSRETPAVMRQAIRIVLDIKKVYEGILVVEVGKINESVGGRQQKRVRSRFEEHLGGRCKSSPGRQ